MFLEHVDCLKSFFSTVTEWRGKVFGGYLGSLRNPLTNFAGLRRATGVTRETSLKVTKAWNWSVHRSPCVFCVSTSRRVGHPPAGTWSHIAVWENQLFPWRFCSCALPRMPFSFQDGSLLALHETVVMRTSLPGLTYVTAFLHSLLCTQTVSSSLPPRESQANLQNPMLTSHSPVSL